jgi:hypothetical protein
MRVHIVITSLALAFVGTISAGCSDDASTTSPSTTTTTPTVAAASVTETFEGTVPVGGSSFYSFTVAENGTVNLTLASVGGAGVPSTAWMGLGLGAPSGIDCSTTSTTNTSAGSAVHLTGTYAPAVYCAKAYDIGNLVSAASVTVTIAHP